MVGVEALVLDRDDRVLHRRRDLVGAIRITTFLLLGEQPERAPVVVVAASSCLRVLVLLRGSRAGAGRRRPPSSSRRRSRRAPAAPRPTRISSSRSLLRRGLARRGRSPRAAAAVGGANGIGARRVGAGVGCRDVVAHASKARPLRRCEPSGARTRRRARGGSGSSPGARV